MTNLYDEAFASALDLGWRWRKGGYKDLSGFIQDEALEYLYAYGIDNIWTPKTPRSHLRGSVNAPDLKKQRSDAQKAHRDANVESRRSGLRGSALELAEESRGQSLFLKWVKSVV